MQIFVNPKYDFVKWRWVAVAISTLIILAGLVTYLTRGINLGIDFKGGASVVLKFSKEVPLPQLRQLVPDGTIQQYGSADERAVLIRLPKQETEGDYAGQLVQKLHNAFNPEAAGGKLDLNYNGANALAAALRQADPDVKGTQPAAATYYDELARRVIEKRSELGIFTSMQQVTSVPGITSGISRFLSERTFLGTFNVLSQETVGPQIGEQLRGKAFWAIILSALAMAIYIGVRFESGLMFGVAALACIIHDVLVAMSFLVMMRLEFSLSVVAALLTIVGYSINDNVVMYDRVRENRRKSKAQQTLADHLNKAINDTLSRTVLTAGSVFLVLLALLIFGGPVIRDFAWILFIGVIAGTFSTLFLVPAVSLAWDKFTGGKALKAPAAKATTTRVPEAPAVRKRKAS